MNLNHISKINQYKHISEKELLRRAEIINSNTEFKQMVENILEKQASEKEEFISQEDINYEETIYRSFSNNHEKIVMEEFHLASWEDKIKVANKFKRDPVVDQKNGNVDLRMNQMAVDQDYFIPVRDAASPSPIETLPGATNLSEIADIEYIQKKLL